MWHRSDHRVLSRRLLQHQPRGPWQPHGLRRGHRRVSRASTANRQRPDHANAAVSLSRADARRSLVCDRIQLAPGPHRRRGSLCRSRIHAPASSRDHPARSSARARGRRPLGSRTVSSLKSTSRFRPQREVMLRPHSSVRGGLPTRIVRAETRPSVGVKRQLSRMRGLRIGGSKGPADAGRRLSGPGCPWSRGRGR
jgi:hypothetical protein